MDTTTTCLVIFAIYAFGDHGKHNALFLLWSLIWIGSLFYIRDVIVILYLSLYQHLQTKTIPSIETGLMFLLTLLPLVRFSYSSASRFLVIEEHGFVSMGLNKRRCDLILEKMGYFPYQAFTSGVFRKKLQKGTPEYRQYCDEFLRMYEDVLL